MGPFSSWSSEFLCKFASESGVLMEAAVVGSGLWRNALRWLWLLFGVFVPVWSEFEVRLERLKRFLLSIRTEPSLRFRLEMSSLRVLRVRGRLTISSFPKSQVKIDLIFKF